MKKPVNTFLRLVLHSNLIIAFAAVLLCLASEVQAGILLRFRSFHILVFAAALSEYSLHRLLKYYSLVRDGRKKRYPWLFSNQLLAWLFFFIPLTAFAVSFFFVDTPVKWIIMGTGAIAFLYSMPVKGVVGFLSLRRIPFVKTFLVALVWSLVTVIVPLTGNSGGISAGKISWIFIERLLLIFPLAMLFDIRDTDSDRKDGIRTIPVVFGEKMTRKLVVVFVLVFIFIYPVTAGDFVLHSHFLPAILWSLPVLWFIYRKPDSENPLYYSLLLDGSLILYGFSVIAGGLIFNYSNNF